MWVTGSKYTFLNQFAADWQEATDQGLVAAGRFYTKVTKRFIKKYGWGFDRWTDKICPDPDPDTLDQDDSQEGLSEDDIIERQKYYRDMRGVSADHLVWTFEPVVKYFLLHPGLNVLVSFPLR